eukprot:767444-Hanusia_phi.AAC.10
MAQRVPRTGSPWYDEIVHVLAEKMQKTATKQIMKIARAMSPFRRASTVSVSLAFSYRKS